MPDSPKIWGTQELGKQSTGCRDNSQLPGPHHPDPKEARGRQAAQEQHPTEFAHSPPVGNQPINTSY